MENVESSLEGCTGVLLCGGKSSRMGFDKAFLRKDGRSLLKSHYVSLKSLFGVAVPVCDRRDKFATDAELSALAFTEDHYPGAGPLGGLCTAFEETDSPWLFLMACDMPKPDFDLARVMAGHRFGVQVVLCVHAGYAEPTFAYYHRSCLPVFLSQIKAGDGRLCGGFAQLAVKKVNVDPQTADLAFANLNTPEDLARWGIR